MEQFWRIPEVRCAHLSVASLIPEVAAREMFDDMPRWDNDAEQEDVPSSVIWDEEFEHNLMHDRLLKKQALDTETFICEDRVYADDKQVPILTTVEGEASKEHAKLDQILESLDLLLARVTEFSLGQQQMKRQLETNTNMIHQHAEIQQILTKQMEATGQAVARLHMHQFRVDEGNSSVLWDSAHERPLADVIWDEEFTHELHTLDQVVLVEHAEEMECDQVPFEAPIMFEEIQQGEEDFGKEKKPATEFSNVSGASLPLELNSGSVVPDEMPHESVISYMLNKENCSSFILDSSINVVDTMFADMDNAEAHAEPAMLRDLMERKHDAGELFCKMPSEIKWDDTPSDTETHDNLLQLVVAAGNLKDEKTIVELDNDEVLTRADDSSLFLECVEDAAFYMLLASHSLDIVDDKINGPIATTQQKILVHAELVAKAIEQLRCDPLMAEQVEFAAQAILRFTQALSVAAIRKLEFGMYVAEQAYVQLFVEFIHSVDQHLTEKMPAWSCNGFSPGKCEQHKIRECMAQIESTSCDLIWDEDLSSDLGMHHELLQQSACLVNEENDKSVIDNRFTPAGTTYTDELCIRGCICFTVMLIIRPWDPGISTATAWGQAVFRGGGNVTTHWWANRSPVAVQQKPMLSKSQSSPREAMSRTYMQRPVLSEGIEQN